MVWLISSKQLSFFSNHVCYQLPKHKSRLYKHSFTQNHVWKITLIKTSVFRRQSKRALNVRTIVTTNTPSPNQICDLDLQTVIIIYILSHVDIMQYARKGWVKDKQCSHSELIDDTMDATNSWTLTYSNLNSFTIFTIYASSCLFLFIAYYCFVFLFHCSYQYRVQTESCEEMLLY